MVSPEASTTMLEGANNIIASSATETPVVVSSRNGAVIDKAISETPTEKIVRNSKKLRDAKSSPEREALKRDIGEQIEEVL